MSQLITQTAQQLRATIERAQAAGADIPWLARFPERCCNFTSNLLLLDLSNAGVSRQRRMMGTVTDDRGNDIASHVWVEAEGIPVDIAGDGYGLKPVVSEPSEWHASLEDIKPFIARIDLQDGVCQDELNRLRDLYQDTLEALAPHRGDFG